MKRSYLAHSSPPGQHAAMHQASTIQPVQLAQAYQHCLGIARNHYENFPTASRLLKSGLRPAVAAIYAFARHADDLADEGGMAPEIRVKKIDAWETLLERCKLNPQIDHPVFMALGDAIHKHNLPSEELHNLLVAFRMDITLHAYASFEELRFYCKHSANPVGRLILALHQINGVKTEQFADHICTALQLINFWQDLSVDLPRGRCYLPQTWLKEHNIESQQLLDGNVTADTLRPVFKKALRITSETLESGVPLLCELPFRLRLQIAATIHAGRRMLNKLEKLENPLQERITLSTVDWQMMMLPIFKDVLFPIFAYRKKS